VQRGEYIKGGWGQNFLGEKVVKSHGASVYSWGICAGWPKVYESTVGEVDTSDRTWKGGGKESWEEKT